MKDLTEVTTMSTDNLEAGQTQVTREFLAEAVKEVFANPQEFADKCKNMPTKLVLYILVLTVCAMIKMIFHDLQTEEQDAEQS